MVDYGELRTVKQMAAEAVFLTESKLCWWIFHADTIGLKSALIKIDGRVYINCHQLNVWLESP